MQVKPGQTTTTLINSDGETVSWDAVEEAVHCTPKCDKSKKMTVAEAAAHFKIGIQGIYRRASAYHWKLYSGHKRRQEIRQAIDWAKRGEEHRDKAFQIGHEAVKKFKPRAPKSFRELEIADRIARRAAGLETAEVINQTLVQLNEAIEDHGEAMVIEATEVAPEPDQVAALTDEDGSADQSEGTGNGD